MAKGLSSLELGECLRDVRETRGWTVYDLSKVSGINEDLIRGIEAGARTPSLRVFKQLAVALRVSTDFLLGLKDSMGGVGTVIIDGVKYRPEPKAK